MNNEPVVSEQTAIGGKEHTSGRWFTTEFLCYYLIVAYAAYKGLKAAYDFTTHPQYHSFNWKLSNGWLFFGRQMDLSDHQWRSFRNAIPMGILLCLTHTLLSRLLRGLLQRRGAPFSREIEVRAVLALGSIFLIHGFNLAKILLILMISYAIGKLFAASRLNPLLSWIMAIGTLVGLDYFALDALLERSRWNPLRGLFALYPGFHPSWHVTFNMTILRMLSFNMDYYYAIRGNYSSLQKHQERCKQCNAATASGSTEDFCEKHRLEEAPDLQLFNFTSYLAYVLYLPLFAAGPIMTFNDFVSQLRRPLTSQTPTKTLIYGLRWIGSFLTLEVLLHLFWVVAIKDTHAWDNFATLDFISLAYFNLKVVWLKLLIIWRFFRFWALADGIVPEENMIRCMSNNYSGLAFWRSWHRSFNRWIVRYMYVPMGGKRTAFWNIWIIFTFVALWHDVQLNLLAWSWLISLFILPEIALRWMTHHFHWDKLPYYRHLAAIGAGGNMFLMSVANLVGFVVKLDGIKVILGSLLTWNGLFFLPGLAIFLFAFAHILLEYRSWEHSHQIYRNF